MNEYGSNESDGTPATDRRVSDRRADPTKPWRILSGPMRRGGGRRATDQVGYVDVYTKHDVGLLLAVFVLNVADAFFTMLWLERGGREANPVMDFFLDISPGAFILQKTFVVGFWLILLLVHKNFRFARLGLYASLVVYGVLIVIHFGIIALGVNPPPEIDTSMPQPKIFIEETVVSARPD